MLLTAEHQAIRDSVRRFAREKLAPSASLRDQAKAFPHDELHELGAMGLLGMLVPAEYGGAGLDYLSMALVLEELGAGDGAVSTIVSVNNSVVCGPLLQFGSAAQRQQWLPALAAGTQLGCFCLTEPQAGSDAASIKTRATRTGNHYVLNGSKQFITTGNNARFWSQPHVVTGSLGQSLANGQSLRVVDGPVWGPIRLDTDDRGWWWQLTTEDTSSTGWLWQERLNECN